MELYQAAVVLAAVPSLVVGRQLSIMEAWESSLRITGKVKGQGRKWGLGDGSRGLLALKLVLNFNIYIYIYT